MLSLADLARLYDDHRTELEHEVRPVEVGGIRIGDGEPALMGVVNLSRDSAYRESVAVSVDSAVRKARVQVAQGAAVVDLGAEATTVAAVRRDPGAQVDQLRPVVEALAPEAVVSVETHDPEVTAACLEAGARMLNMTGREHEEDMLDLAAKHDAAVVMCFSAGADVRDFSEAPVGGDAVPDLLGHFGPRLEQARERGVTRVLVDPGLGFTYTNLGDHVDRARHQARMLLEGGRLRSLGVPLCNALPHAFDVFEEEFRTAEGFFGFLAWLGGTHLYRVHEVARVRATLRAAQVL